MKIRANRAYEIMGARIAQHADLLRPWQGTGYRVTTLDYPSPQSILLGEGSFLYGGRWNAPGSFRAVYGSIDDMVAVAESRANAEYAGIPFPFRTPRLLVTIEFNLRAVLDLTAVVTRKALEIRLEELRAEDWRKVQSDGFESFTQGLGRAVFGHGANGLLVPSARIAGGVNVVYLPQNRSEKEEATVCEPEKLERIRGKDL
ncbi:MAG: RES family NAD+ phosphorylase [Chthoniobacterales bacterium]